MPYWFFIVVGISLLGGVLLSVYNRHNYRHNWRYMFVSPFIFFGIVVVFALPQMALTADSPRYSQRITEDTVIHSLRTNEQVSGNFALGCGSIANETYYIYYTKDTDGAYSINELKAGECKLFMDRDSGGVLTKVWGKIDDENLAKHWGMSETIFSHYEFHLPYGSLVHEYNAQ
jgi:hypothetical protein